MTEIMPTAAQIREARVAATLAAAPSDSARGADPSASTKLAIEQMRTRAAEDASQLDHFVEAVAEFFDCPQLVSDHLRVRMREPFLELRQLAHRLNAEADRRGEARPATAKRHSTRGKSATAEPSGPNGSEMTRKRVTGS